MTYLEKFEELKSEFNIDKNFEIIINKGVHQVVYSISDETDTTLWIDFNLNDNTYSIVVDTPKGIVDYGVESF
jgi:hypothetical protein